MIYKIIALAIILRMYRKWKDQIYEIGDCTICKHVGTDKCDKCVCGTEWERRREVRNE